MPSWLATALSVIAGGLLTIFAAWLSDRRLTERERNRRREERYERIVTRRNDFQRETLLALQVASQKLLRTTGAMHHLDVMAARTTGKRCKQFPEDLSDDHLHHNTETMLLASRVRDDEARSLADQVREYASGVSLSKDEAEASNRMIAAAETQQALVRRIGHLVRSLDEID